MIPDDKVLQIAHKVLRKSRDGHVRWILDSSTHGNRYIVSVQGNQISLMFGSPHTEPDYYALRIFNKDHLVVADILASADGPVFDLLRDLYQEACRCVTQWDKTLRTIETELDKDGEFGEYPEGNIPF